MNITPQEAATELLRRRRARRSLVDFSQSISIPGAPVNEDADEWLFKPIETAVALHHRVIMDAIQTCIEKDSGRLMIFAPPGSAKSTYASVVTPPWAMARQPGYKVILTSYAATPAERQSKRARSIVGSPEYASIWPDSVMLRAGSGAVNEWELTNDSGLLAVGILGAVTSARADLLIIDDPVAGREEAESETTRKKTRQAYEDDLLTRLKPRASIIIIQCMAGDTPVLMADGSEKPIRDIKRGERVASYEDGAISAATVLNWINHGPDCVYAIKMSSGTIVKANERHPFLVRRFGETEWVRLKNLRVGDEIVRASQRTGESGKASPVGTTDATSQQRREDSAHPITTSIYGQADTDHLPSTHKAGATHTCGTDTVLTPANTNPCSQSREETAQSAANRQQPTCAPIGEASYASITATTQAWFADSCATTATLPSDTGKLSKSCALPLSTYAITVDAIVEIVPCGSEDVFDIEVERTENFIANGLVSHNTRWHQSDLAGSILPEDYDGRSGEVVCTDGQVWTILNIQAKAERSDDPLGRKIGDYLWPEWFDARHWANFETNARTWGSLYQQRPAPDTGGQFEKAWFEWYDDPPQGMKVYGSSDWAVTEATLGTNPDFSEHGVFGQDEHGNVYALDWWYGQTPTDKTCEEMLDLARQWKPRQWFNEAGVIRRAVDPLLKRIMREKKSYIAVDYLTSSQDKVARVASFRGLVSAGQFYLPRGKPWATRLQDQLCAFPFGRYDDAVDVCGNLGRALDMLRDGEGAPASAKPPPKPFTAEWFAWRDKERAGDKPTDYYR